MPKTKEETHWTVQFFNKSCFEAGKIVSKVRHLAERFNWDKAANSASVAMETATEKAEKLIESVKRNVLDIGESFKSGYTTSKAEAKRSSASDEAGASAEKKSAAPKKRRTSSSRKSAAKKQKPVSKNTDEPAPDEASSEESQDLEKEIEEITGQVEDSGNAEEEAAS